jgi:hypothetical protein
MATHFKILRGVLELENFTRAELCFSTGLRGTQVYRELADLQKAGLLSSQRAPLPDGQRAARHRPPKVYGIRNEEAKRQLQEEFFAIFPTGEGQGPEQRVREQRVRDELGSLALELQGSPEWMSDEGFKAWSDRLTERLTAAGEDLQRLIWESDADLSQTDQQEHPLVLLWRRYESLQPQLNKLISEEKHRRMLKKVADFFGANLKPVPILGAGASLRTAPNWGGTWVSKSGHTLSENKAIWRALEASWRHDFGRATNHIQRCAVSAKHLIAHGGDPNVAFDYLHELAAHGADRHPIFNFDEACLALLADEHRADAQKYWEKSLETPMEKKPRLFVCAPRLTKEACDALVSSVSAQAPAVFTFIGHKQALAPTLLEYTVKPQVYDPVSIVRPNSRPGLIPVSDAIIGPSKFYVATTGIDKTELPGVGAVTVATLVADCGVAREKAWQTGLKVDEGATLIVLDFPKMPPVTQRNKFKTICREILGPEASFCG